MLHLLSPALPAVGGLYCFIAKPLETLYIASLVPFLPGHHITLPALLRGTAAPPANPGPAVQPSRAAPTP